MSGVAEVAEEVGIVVGDSVLFQQYNETEEHEGIVLEAPEEGKLTVQFEDELGTLKINRCYLRKKEEDVLPEE